MSKPKDHTGCMIICLALGCIGLAIFGVVMELMKFAALVKWVFT